MSIVAGQTGLAADFIQTLVAGETLSTRDAVYLKVSDGKAYKCDADDPTTINFLGFVVTGVSSGANVNIKHDGQMTGFSGLTAGSYYYISGTSGAITATSPAISVAVALALSSSVVKILPAGRKITVFTANGTYTKASGAKSIEVVAVGAGGGGGNSYDLTPVGGGGGGGGALNSAKLQPDLVTATVTVTVSSSTAINTDGVNTTFGSYLTANGGKKGANGTGGGAGAGGAGGTATGSGIAGGAGGAGSGNYGGGGGGAAGSVGAVGASTFAAGGAAGTTSSLLGAGGNGAVINAAGSNGNTYGGGGGGGSDSNNTVQSGGLGAGGICIVIEYF